MHKQWVIPHTHLCTARLAQVDLRAHMDAYSLAAHTARLGTSVLNDTCVCPFLYPKSKIFDQVKKSEWYISVISLWFLSLAPISGDLTEFVNYDVNYLVL